MHQKNSCHVHSMSIFRVMATEEEYWKINACTKNYSILGYQYSGFRQEREKINGFTKYSGI